MPHLYMTVGLPRSGKSTWCRRQNLPMVNPDSIRLSIHGKDFDAKHEEIVWWTTKIMVESLFRAGHERVILDATSITRATRDKWVNPMWERIAVVFTVNDIETLKLRAMQNDKPALIPVIDRMARWYEPISGSEGFVMLLDGSTNIVH